MEMLGSGAALPWTAVPGAGVCPTPGATVNGIVPGCEDCGGAVVGAWDVFGACRPSILGSNAEGDTSRLVVLSMSDRKTRRVAGHPDRLLPHF